MNGRAIVFRLLETLCLVPLIVNIRLFDGVFTGGEFHLTEIYDLVCTIYYHINLSAIP